MATSAQRHVRHRRRAAHGPLWAPLLLFTAVSIAAVAYVGYVLWPRWPEAPVTLGAPSVPIMIAGMTFNIEPAAIRNAVQRRPGRQDRVDLVYRWPSLEPPEPDIRPASSAGAPPDLSERLFITIQTADGTLPLPERVRDIYPRYLMADPVDGPDGLTLHGFGDDTPYAGEQLAFDAAAPAHFLARCTLKGVSDSGACLLERRIGDADITVRFPRAWLNEWRMVAGAVDRLLARLHPQKN